MKPILYGIKNCDTVRKSRDWLDKSGVAYRFHDFRIDGLDGSQVQRWLDSLGVENLINKRSTTWKELDETTRENAMRDPVQLILDHPTLIKRPLLENNNQYFVGFKADDYAHIFAK